MKSARGMFGVLYGKGFVSFYTHLPTYEDGTDRAFETSAYKIHTPGNNPKESKQQ